MYVYLYKPITMAKEQPRPIPTRPQQQPPQRREQPTPLRSPQPQQNPPTRKDSPMPGQGRPPAKT